nr:glycosyltransferase [uncultured Spirosoma sp.]
MFVKDITLDGGCERVVVNMVNEFIKHYSYVHILSNFQSNLEINYKIDDQVKIHYLHPNISLHEWEKKHIFSILFKITFIHNFVYSLCFTSKLYRYIRKSNPMKYQAIVMFHGYQTAWYKKSGIKLVGVDHSNFPYDKTNLKNKLGKLKFWIESFMNRKLDIVTCLTNAEIDYWRLLGRPIFIMPNFVSIIPEIIPSFESRSNKIISMGRMNTNQKGFDLLIHAFAKIAHKIPNWELEIYGNGHFKSKYNYIIKKLNIQNQVKIKDFTKNPQEIFLSTSIFVLCSRSEGFGLVLAEAMACGMAAIAYENTGPNAIIKNNYSGILVPNGNEEILCKKLIMLIRNTKFRKEISIKSRKNVIKNFSPNIIIGKWIEIFDLI